MTPNYKKTKYACFYTYLAAAAIFCLPPMLFMIFHEKYGLSFTLLGSLVVANFCTQLGVDLIFSFWGKHLDPHLALRISPLLTSLGLLTYALIPMFFPQYAYAGLLIGTFIFSVAAGLSEVLVSPTVDSLPSDTHDRDMAALHSLYGYGLVTVIIISTVILYFIGSDNWMYLVMFWAIPPIFASILLFTSPLPDMNKADDVPIEQHKSKNFGLILCMFCIFFGSCAENTMTNWISSFAELALGVPKALGDLFGLMLFAILLSLTRTWYAKYGKKIYKVLMVSMVSAIFCYLIAGISPVPIIAMIACVLTGICTSMLWPGTLIYMEEKIPSAGVVGFALMAAGGDLGASIAPELIGVVTDTVSVSDWGITLSQTLAVTPEQLGMKIGMLISMIFPILGVFVLLYMNKYFKKSEKAL